MQRLLDRVGQIAWIEFRSKQAFRSLPPFRRPLRLPQCNLPLLSLVISHFPRAESETDPTLEARAGKPAWDRSLSENPCRLSTCPSL